MPPELANYIIQYGYYTIFTLVFLQEVGVPNPVTNELVLLFSGYLAYTHRLSLILVILTVVLADFTGTSLLYFVFYLVGDKLMRKGPKWLPVEKIEKLKLRVAARGKWGVFLGRLLPYLRGYTSVAAGLLRIPPQIFLSSVILSAILWSGGYVIAGRLLGSRWDSIAAHVGFKAAIFALVMITLLIIMVPKVHRRFSKKHQV